MIFELEFEGDDEEKPKPNNISVQTPNPNDEEDLHHNDDPHSEGDHQEDKPVTRSLSATHTRSKPEPQILQQPMAFSYNTGRSWDKSKRVQKKLDHVHKKPQEKKPNNQDSSSLKMN